MEAQKQQLARAREKALSVVQSTGGTENDATPQERIESAFTELRETLTSDLLSKLKSMDHSDLSR